jgi:hypothetical protein
MLKKPRTAKDLTSITVLLQEIVIFKNLLKTVLKNLCRKY